MRPFHIRGTHGSRGGTEDLRQVQLHAALPAKIIHVRWSGEGCWIPLGSLDLGLTHENATSHPAPGEILLYPGGLSETEILLAYGAVQFSSKVASLPATTSSPSWMVAKIFGRWANSCSGMARRTFSFRRSSRHRHPSRSNFARARREADAIHRRSRRRAAALITRGKRRTCAGLNRANNRNRDRSLYARCQDRQAPRHRVSPRRLHLGSRRHCMLNEPIQNRAWIARDLIP